MNSIYQQQSMKSPKILKLQRIYKSLRRRHNFSSYFEIPDNVIPLIPKLVIIPKRTIRSNLNSDSLVTNNCISRRKLKTKFRSLDSTKLSSPSITKTKRIEFKNCVMPRISRNELKKLDYFQYKQFQLKSLNDSKPSQIPIHHKPNPFFLSKKLYIAQTANYKSEPNSKQEFTVLFKPKYLF